MPARRSRNQGVTTINASDVALARSRGAQTLDYYRRFGLAEVRGRTLALIGSGLAPIVGLSFLGWTMASLLVFMVVDAVICLLIDWVRYPLARRWMAVSHRLDHEASEVLGIVDGLEDGSGTRPARNNKPEPGLILGISTVMTLFMVPVVAAVVEPLGLDSIRAVLAQPYFVWLLVGDLGLRLLGALSGVLQVRRQPPGEAMIFVESGGVAVLYAGLLILVWLPISFGTLGVALMFAVLALVRIAFGAFAWWWVPRSLAALERRMAADDWSTRKRSVRA
ncbi:MAG: hypothetical protein U1F26_08660 [Lysobacterales bacterium]